MDFLDEMKQVLNVEEYEKGNRYVVTKTKFIRHEDRYWYYYYKDLEDAVNACYEIINDPWDGSYSNAWVDEIIDGSSCSEGIPWEHLPVITFEEFKQERGCGSKPKCGTNDPEAKDGPYCWCYRDFYYNEVP